MSVWIDEETATAKFGTVKAGKPRVENPKSRASKAGNERLKRRYRRILDSMCQKPSLKFPAGCRGNAEVKAAYRFLDNEHVTFLSILAPHRQATIARIQEQPVVLIPQDTTELDLTKPRQNMQGTGPLNDSARLGFHDHVSMAVTPEQLPLGVVHAKVWARDPDEFQKDAGQKRAERRAKSIEDKESIRWLEGYRAACDVANEAPNTQIISLADSEADIYELLTEGGAVEGVRKASFIVRACQNRALAGVEKPAPGESPIHLREQVANTPIQTRRTLEICGRDPKSKDDRKRKQPRDPRVAEVAIQATRVTLRGPSRPGGRLEDIAINVVLVTELDPPPGAEPIEWILLTDLPIDNVADILQVIDYYTCRWHIEIYYRVLKSGCKVEESQLEKASRFEPYLALNMIVAWRVMYVMMLGRDCPDMACDIVLDDDEWQAVYATVKKEPPPSKPPSMGEMVRLIATLGGWLGRKCDGDPGPKAMWVGMQRMTDLALGWSARALVGSSVAKKLRDSEEILE